MYTSEKYTFYREADKAGSVIAVYQPTSNMVTRRGHFEGLAAVYPFKNSSVMWTPIHPNALGEEITEEEARALHPRLFDHLDRDHTNEEE